MLAVAILAAGKGTRMKSSLPKVLQPLGGKSLINRVLSSCQQLNADRTLIVVGHNQQLIRQHLSEHSYLEFIQQEPQNGTGHAVQQLVPILQGFEGDLLVLNGDVPLLKEETIQQLISNHRKYNAGVTLLSASIEDPKGYGRVFVKNQTTVTKIIEEKDCSLEQKKNKLTNAGIYCFNWQELSNVLPRLSSNNNQNELYITDTVGMLKVARHMEVEDSEEVCGVNDRLQMQHCEDIIQKRLREYWMKEGVTFIDSSSCTLSEESKLGKDIIIEPQTHLRGKCLIGSGCKIGPGTLIKDSILGDNVSIIMSYVSKSKVDSNVTIGPFAHLRPETVIGSNCKIGNFVEIKKSIVGKGTKINHLSYIGDSQLGKNINIGAGTITANYDGVQKHKTLIGDGVKTGANSVLIAPITLGKGVTVGAGSTLTKDVPNNSLALTRSKQLVKENWNKNIGP